MKASWFEADWVLRFRAYAHENSLASYTFASRFVLLITALLLAFMPWMEHLWTFDRFFRGGQDLEFGLLVSVSILCLVLLLSELRRQGFLQLVGLQVEGGWFAPDGGIALLCASFSRGVWLQPILTAPPPLALRI